MPHIFPRSAAFLLIAALSACAPTTPLPASATLTLEPTASPTEPAPTPSRTPAPTHTPTETVPPISTRAPISHLNIDAMLYVTTTPDQFPPADFIWHSDGANILITTQVDYYLKAWGSSDWQDIPSCTEMELSSNGVIILGCGDEIVSFNLTALEEGWHDFDLITIQPFTDLAVSPDAQIVAAAHDGLIALIDVPSGEVLGRLNMGNSIRSIAFSPDGTMLASVNNVGSVWLWDVADQRSLNAFRGGGGVSLVTFSPDTILLAGASESAIHLWFVQTAGILATIPTNHSETITALAFHPSGEMLASGGQDGAFTIWDGITGTPLLSADLAATVLRIAWSPDATRLAALTADGKQHFWLAP